MMKKMVIIALMCLLYQVVWLAIHKDLATAQTILDSSHDGWKSTHCEYCHFLPVAGHTTSDTGECSTCHGGNGSCNPNGPESARKGHLSTDACITCHLDQHGYIIATACVNCHFASSGVEDCVSGSLSTGLISHCYNWPDEEFSSTNRASLGTGVSEGDTAIDFTLKDIDGVSATLSDLLKTKPVLMVFGSYT